MNITEGISSLIQPLNIPYSESISSTDEKIDHYMQRYEIPSDYKNSLTTLCGKEFHIVVDDSLQASYPLEYALSKTETIENVLLSVASAILEFALIADETGAKIFFGNWTPTSVRSTEDLVRFLHNKDRCGKPRLIERTERAAVYHERKNLNERKRAVFVLCGNRPSSEESDRMKTVEISDQKKSVNMSLFDWVEKSVIGHSTRFCNNKESLSSRIEITFFVATNSKDYSYTYRSNVKDIKEKYDHFNTAVIPCYAEAKALIGESHPELPYAKGLHLAQILLASSNKQLDFCALPKEEVVKCTIM